MLVEEIVSEQDVWQWCFESYLRNGIKLRLPIAKNHTQTYQWRFVKSITKKFIEWKFNQETCRKFIDIAVSHSKELGVLTKGLSVLHQHNMMNICYAKLKQESERSDHTQKKLADTHIFLNGLKTNDPKSYLLKRPHQKALPNIISLYLAKQITVEYMSISKLITNILNDLENTREDERSILPTDASLYFSRRKIFESHRDSEIVREILQGGW
jgi:hypothetical protein